MINFIIDFMGFLFLWLISSFFILPNIVFFSGDEFIVVSSVLLFLLLLFIYFEVISYSPNQKNIIVMRNINSIFVIVGLFGTLISLAFSFYGLYNLVGGTQAEITSNLKNLLSQIKLVFIPSILGVYFTIWGTLKLTIIERIYFSQSYEVENFNDLVSNLSKLEELAKVSEQLEKFNSTMSDLKDIFERLYEVSNNIRKGINELYNLPKFITSELNETIKTINNILIVSLDNVGKSINEVSNRLDEMIEKISKTYQVLDNVNEKYQKLAEAINQTTIIMSDLNNKVNDLLNFTEEIKNLNQKLDELNVNLVSLNQFTNNLPSTIEKIYNTYIQTFRNLEDTIKTDLPLKLKSIEYSFNNFRETIDEFNKKLEKSIDELKEIKTIRESLEKAVEEGLESGISKYLGEPIKNLNDSLLHLSNQLTLFEEIVKEKIGRISESANNISEAIRELKPLIFSIEKLVKTFDTPILFRFALGKKGNEINKRKS
ncbi:MAG: hypothetical protein ABIL76_01980 [candidate division WOR-3 bacterium]